MKTPFFPDARMGAYKLAPSVYEKIILRLKLFKNRDWSFRLAVFVAKKHAIAKRIGTTFVLCRFQLQHNTELGISENKIRGAIKTLMKIGFIEAVPDPKGTIYRNDEIGKRRRLATQFRFAHEFWRIFSYILSRMAYGRKGGEGSSPKCRGNKKLLESKTREAQHLGEKGAATAYSRAPARDTKTGAAKFMGNLFSKPSSALRDAAQAVKTTLKGRKLPMEENDALTASLSRYEHLFRSRSVVAS